MKPLRALYHFLGGLKCALLLIASASLFVAAGTILESLTGSHRYAAMFTYHHPLFGLLLWGFFINILFAALRRWPFQIKHIPFLITHLGLLMIFGGALAKYYFGLQGTMTLVEGRGSSRILENGTYALSIKERNTLSLVQYPLNEDEEGENFKLKTLKLHVKNISPHTTEHFEFWIKKDQLTILGLEPMPVTEVSSETTEIIPSGHVRFEAGSPNVWTIYALRTLESNIDEVIHQLPVNITTLAVIEDEYRDIHFIGFDIKGHITRQKFENGHFDSIIAYDNGFQGYTIKKDLRQIKQTQEETKENHQIISGQLKIAADDQVELSPPLEMLHEASLQSHVDFADTTVLFLSEWDAAGTWLYPDNVKLSEQTEKMLSNLNWKSVPENEYNGAKWTVQLFDYLDPFMKEEPDIIKVLRKTNWPLLPQVEKSMAEGISPLAILTAQIFGAADSPLLSRHCDLAKTEGDSLKTPQDNARLLSAVLRKYDIHLKTISPPSSMQPQDSATFTIETKLVPIHQTAIPKKKLEDNFPGILVQARKANRSEEITLRYDPTAEKLQWPILDGEYLLSFQPKFRKIPYRVRLREARQINYPNSSQAFSFEGELLITDERDGQTIETSISMNHVYETWDGYRFYLSTMTPSDESAVKRVQLAVNYNPGKYFLTYLGACLLVCGMIALFIKYKA